MNRLARCALVALTLATLPTPRVLAQGSGVLLGLHVASSDSGEFYRTYWIARQGASVRLEAAGPDLVVPRKSGFWRVCLVSGHDTTDGELTEWDSLVAAPATASRGRCAVRTKPPSDEERQNARCDGSYSTQILFVGSDYLSRSLEMQTDCGMHAAGGTNIMLTRIGDAAGVDFAALVEPRRKRALVPATLRAGRKAFEDFGVVDSVETEPTESSGARLTLTRSWTVERGEGRWQTVGQVTCSPYVACGDDLRTFSISEFPAPAAIVGPDLLSPALDKVRAIYPKVRDAVSSPRRDLLVAVTADSLLVFALNDGRLDAPALRLPISGRIVMAQWAVGRFVPVWTEKLKELLSP